MGDTARHLRGFGQSLTHAHSQITRGVASKFTCFRFQQLVCQGITVTS